ncbi:MAG: hypothetical protein AB9836_04860 [Aminipila sp.]
MNRTEILKIAKPILFNTAMTRAILDNRKTATRRIVKGLGNSWHIDKLLGDWGLSKKPYIDNGKLYWDLQTDVDDSRIFTTNLPYSVGDILYVRETSMIQSMKAFGKKVKMLFKADDSLIEFNVSDEEYERLSKWELFRKWLSPYWTTKETARIFLKVTDVRAERLQSITEEQAEKEGSYKSFDSREVHSIKEKGYYISGFRQIWNSTLDKKDLKIYGWNANPWVWVFEFERMEVSHE